MYKIGYFSTSQQITFGKNKANNIIYKINVFNEKNNYMVSYGGKLKGKIIIKFKILDDKKGQIIDIIGLMEDNILLLTLQYVYNIFYKSIYIKELQINNNEKYINRQFIDKFIFSIDPFECNDIDDALSFEENDNYYIISVYIAQPITYLTIDIIKEHSNKAFSTLYNEPYNKNKNLWGELITINSSLKINELRNAYAIIFYINKLNYNFDNIEHYPVKIINKLNTNYNDCLNYDIINKLYNITNNINKINDTHELISYWMVKTNNYIGDNYNLPKRVIKKSLNIIDNIDYLDNDIKEIFINKASDNAYYSLTENYHYILNKFNYIHMTSPIRRIIDTINHWCITYNIDFNNLDIDLNKINNLDRLTKKYHNNIKLLDIINNLEEDITYIYNGWIYKNNWKECLLNNKSIKITVYFKELGFQRVELLNNKLNYLLNDNMFDNIKIGIKYKFEILKKKGFLPNEKILIKIIY